MYHLHGRTMLDVHVHQLLLYAVFGQALVAFMEVFHRGNIILELLRCTLTILQGSWFWQVHVNQREHVQAEVFVTSLLSNTWRCFLLRLVMCCTLRTAQSGTWRIPATWCSSPCVTPGTSPSPCSSWACSTALSTSENLFITVYLSWMFYRHIYINSLSAFNGTHSEQFMLGMMSDSGVCCAFSAAWFAPDWRGLPRWKWGYWNPETGIQTQRMTFYEDDCCSLTIKSGIRCVQFQQQYKQATQTDGG